MRRETDFIHGICEFCRRMDSAYPGAPRDDVEVKLVEHISCREFLALRGFARDLCTGISRFLADSRENETVSIAMRIKDHGLYLCNYYDRQKSYGTIATADREKTFSNVKWLFRRKLCASHSTGITGLFRTFSQLLHYQVLTDAAGNELLCLCDDHRKTIPLSVEDKTAYEAVNNHEHLLDDISDEAFSELVADAPVLCRLIYCNIKMQYPQRKLAVYVAVSRHDSLTIRFHQVWTGEPPYYDPEDFSSGDAVNQALSAGHACLYGLAHAVITALGCSAGLGFMHVGHECSFVYDIADLYKAEVTIPVAFEMAAQQPDDLPSATRRRGRDAMVSAHILERMVRDIHILFSDDEWIAEEITTEIVYLWDDKKGTVPNGISYGFQEEEST